MNLQRTADDYHRQLIANPDAVAILTDTYGLTERTLVRQRLGFIETPVDRQHDWAVHTYTLPYIATTGKPHAIRINPFQYDEVARYDAMWLERSEALRNLTDTHIFNARYALPGVRPAPLRVFEDCHSALIAKQMGLRAIAIPGYANFQDHWIHLLTPNELLVYIQEERQWGARTFAELLRTRGVRHQLRLLPGKRTFGQLFQTIDSQINFLEDGDSVTRHIERIEGMPPPDTFYVPTPDSTDMDW